MTMPGNWLQRIAVLAILINIPAIGAHFYFAHRFYSAAVLSVGLRVTPVTGVTTEGHEAAATVRECHVLRYTSIHCQWCRKDEPAWQAFEKLLQQRGCDSTLFGPAADDLPKDAVSTADRHWLAVVPASVAKEMNFFATPTTIVFDRQWRVVWSRMGILDKGDLESAEDKILNLK
jgi:hypothetical protein